MTRLNQPFTVGKWMTKAGREAAFVAEWKQFADWTAGNQPGAGTGYLLQDPERPQNFLSFGPWENAEAIQAWRDRPEFKAFASRAKELCEEFLPQSFVLVASTDR